TRPFVGQVREILVPFLGREVPPGGRTRAGVPLVDARVCCPGAAGGGGDDQGLAVGLVRDGVSPDPAGKRQAGLVLPGATVPESDPPLLGDGVLRAVRSEGRSAPLPPGV